MPWKERYTISDERTLPDPDVRWPDGKRCCFRVVVDLAPASGPEGIKPQDPHDTATPISACMAGCANSAAPSSATASRRPSPCRR